MPLSAVLDFAVGAYALALAVAVAVRARRFLARWMFVGGILVLAAEAFCVGQAERAIDVDAVVVWHRLRLQALSWLPGFWLVFSLTYARGQIGGYLARWRIAIVTAFLLPPALTLAGAGQLLAVVPEPGGFAAVTLHLGVPALGLHVLLVLAAVLVLMNLERTYRAAVGTTRWRIKFMLLGVAVVFAVRIYTSSQALLYHTVQTPLAALSVMGLGIGCMLVTRTLFRTGHFTVDVYPSQTVLLNSVSVVLAGTYLLLVGVLAEVVSYLGGDAAFMPKAFLVLVALVLLAMALLSDHFRLRVRRFVSRHFQRPLYDTRTVWRRLSEETASSQDRAALARAVVHILAELFQSLTVTIWLTDPARRQLLFGASTAASESAGAAREPTAVEAETLVRYFEKHPDPVDFESLDADWARTLRANNPREFPRGGNRLCVPLMVRGNVAGILVMGDRVGGALFAAPELDLLKCVGNQVASGLLGLDLSLRLQQARELEAFQAMAAFFVHDLKNAASTLTLMLENLPVHFDDPEFRADTLRGVATTVEHINSLIARLGLLRHGLQIRPAPEDLNQVVRDVLGRCPTRPGVALEPDLQPLPPVPLDPAQIGTVITNLVLNAAEAVAASGGTVRVSTRASNGAVELAVSDDGCGMTAEFIQHSLFRPFKTTKQRGMGIGMFQSKFIVEAHHGHIDVESRPGEGTTFRVRLPQNPPSA